MFTVRTEGCFSLYGSVPPGGLTLYRGLQAFESLLKLFEARLHHEEFCIPMCMLPATISNNVPGTDLSIGADTALNAVVEVRARKEIKKTSWKITLKKCDLNLWREALIAVRTSTICEYKYS